MTWYKNPTVISVALGAISYVVAYLTPYSSSNVIIGVVVTLASSLALHLKADLPSTTTTTGGGSGTGGGGTNTNIGVPVAPVQVQNGAPTFTQDGVTIPYPLWGAIGKQDTYNGNTYVVGQQYNGGVSKSGDVAPNGAFYLGNGVFGYNGNTWN